MYRVDLASIWSDYYHQMISYGGLEIRIFREFTVRYIEQPIPETWLIFINIREPNLKTFGARSKLKKNIEYSRSMPAHFWTQSRGRNKPTLFHLKLSATDNIALSLSLSHFIIVHLDIHPPVTNLAASFVFPFPPSSPSYSLPISRSFNFFNSHSLDFF